MDEILWVALAGFGASFVDGALGMGFGATGSTLLMGMGLPPQIAAGTVNLAKVATGLASGVSHWKFKNIDRNLVLRVGIPGCAGGILGATLASYINPGALKFVMASLLTLIGVRLFVRFAVAANEQTVVEGNAVSEASKPSDHTKHPEPMGVPTRVAGVEAAGLAGGLVNGMIGAWGPIVTPYLLYRRVSPRYAIGVSNTAEVFVAFASAAAIIFGVGTTNFDLRLLGAMLFGGVLAAPVAAWLIRYVPARPMGLATASLLVLLNSRELSSHVPEMWQRPIVLMGAAFLALWIWLGLKRKAGLAAT